MRAVLVHDYGDPSVMSLADVDEPITGPHDLRIAVHGTSVNPVDAKIRSGAQRSVIRLQMPAVLGMDVSGVVLEVGSQVTDFVVGDEVFASPSHKRMGCYAEQVVVRANECALKPTSLTHLEATGIPLVGLTAWDALVDTCSVQPGQRVLIQAGSGGVGSFAVQLAKHLGAEVYATCSGRNVELVRSLGADHVIDYRSKSSTKWRRPRRCARLFRRRAPRPRCSHCPAWRRRRRPSRRTSRSSRANTDLGSDSRYSPQHFARQIVVARTPRCFDPSRDPQTQRRKSRPDRALIDDGEIRPVIDQVIPLEEVTRAHGHLETVRARGKVILQVR